MMGKAPVPNEKPLGLGVAPNRGVTEAEAAGQVDGGSEGHTGV